MGTLVIADSLLLYVNFLRMKDVKSNEGEELKAAVCHLLSC